MQTILILFTFLVVVSAVIYLLHVNQRNSVLQTAELNKPLPPLNNDNTGIPAD